VNLARLEFEERGRALLVRVEGEIDLSNAQDIRSDVTDAVPQGAAGVVLDLTATTYLDSSGIRLLFDLAQRLHARRQQLVLVVTDEALVRRVIVLTKLDDAVPLHTTLDDALAALNGA
jgi:anti-sigma B factor antagonist/stage II sporulation protein AA (anti-sigma F factor antagonist)